MTDAIPSRRRRRTKRRTAALGVTAVAVASFPVLTGSTSASATSSVIRLVAGTVPVTDEAGAVWAPDEQFADGGTTWTSTHAVSGTTNDRVFQPERWGVRGYHVPVPASGSYRVTLNAAEVVFTGAGRRVFSVSAESTRAVTDLDLVRAVGADAAYAVTFTTTVTDGVLDLDLAASVDNTKVSSLVIEPVTATSTVARVVAGDQPVTDAGGSVWAPDDRLADGGSAWASTTPIGGTTVDQLFNRERWGVRGYDVPVPAPGSYTVTVNAAELVFTQRGQRVFSVAAEGQTKLKDVDLVAAAGARNAWTGRFTVTVTDGVLRLRLPASVNSAKVSSLLVESGTSPIAAPTPSPTPAPPTTSLFGTPITTDPIAPRGVGFGTGSVWRTSIRTAPLASSSAALVANLTNQVNSLYGGNAAFNVWQYSGMVYTVPASQSRVDIRWNDCQGKGSEPTGLLGPGGQFSGVPLPSNAAGSNGTDASASIYQPSTDTMWDFWKLAKHADGWYACWGGRIDKVSTNRGWFLNGFGSTATGLAGEGGMVNIRDVQAGSIDHALSLAVLRSAKGFSWPAQRSDGTDTASDALPEGTRLRLDPSFNVDATSMHPIAKMIAKAAQTYGFIVTDRAGVVGVSAESGTPAETLTGSNPWPALLNGTPSYSIMSGFPWSRLQALPQDYGKS